jgi:hypothetical protein
LNPITGKRVDGLSDSGAWQVSGDPIAGHCALVVFCHAHQLSPCTPAAREAQRKALMTDADSRM